MVKACTSVLILISSLFSLLFTLVLANISPGTTLRPSDSNTTWTSPNNTFSLSFITITSPNPPSFVAAISYYGISVWKAGGYSGTVDIDGSFQFLQNGNLRLVNGNGSVIWESGTANRGITTATLDDSGNLSLKNDSVSVWSTFDNPTDTILPTQNFTTGMLLRSGLYSFNLLDTGNLTLKWNNSIVYWNPALNSTYANLTSPSLSIQAVGIVTLNDPTFSTPAIVVYSSDYGEGTDVLRFLKLDSDGNLRIYSSARGYGVEFERWVAVADQCMVFGYCGNMGVCHYNDMAPVCGCPSENFVFADPNDTRKGCQRKMKLEDCSRRATMLKLDHAQFLTYPPELSSQLFTVGISACSSNCLQGPCTVSTSLADGTGECYIKTSDFNSGYMSPALPSTSFVKVCSPVLPNSPPTEAERGERTWKLNPWVVVVVVAVTLLGLTLLEGGLWWSCCRKSPNFGGLSTQYALLEYASGAPVQFNYKELQHITKGFREKLGAGGFGSVHQGILANRTVVAVKQLEGIEQGEKQFKMEVATISSTHHLNLVRLIGFCSEGRHRLLVLEFMKNGSLDNFLFTSKEPLERLLDWKARFKIALGTARGITYLHEECRDCIVHCDIKPENILLDENYNAKVSDFGLTKLINPKDHRHRTLTSVRGTRGYLAPEWLANLPMTSKSDVYSYGLVLLEIVSGRRNFEVSEDTGRKKFSLWAYEEFDKGNVENIVDKRLTEHRLDMEQVMRAIQVSFWCIQEQQSQRPMMGKVVHMLEGISAIEKPPAPNTTAKGSVSVTSMDNSFAVNVLSTLVTSVPATSSSSSLQAMEISSSPTSMNTEITSSPLLHQIEVSP
ncbi:G-type lectin S-receptor-like serine/threonine-protein kinase At1g34300 [Telopea speciosissima]|uniref:G-type lectin S-receptor-like serine/threonine-protein kinase At1g34300 n=1 Tax=Telopea speciosissima TaxID=54955 RepID=UPI001CC3850F|nr:G-type lectin S-receptor-like serine/threonine-protein kinase At1g34300 [Telopea speciosissima]